MTTIVIMPGGFHPPHSGHMSLYNSAQRTFPDAEVYVAATNDTSSRPFPFAVKEKLAKLAGVEAGHFVQVKSPFRAEEITSKFDPEKDVLIFVRSEKDANTPPQAGGVKKDGSPSYLQPLLDAKRLEPFSKHAYMAYLPTVEFGPGMTSATQIRNAWPGLDERRKTALVMSLYPKTQTSPQLATTVVKLLDAAIGGQEVAEGFPQPGESSGKAKQFNPNAKVQTKEMTLDQILATVKGIPYVNNVVDDWDAKDYSWGVTKKVIEYAEYLQKNPQSVANLPPLVVIDGQLNDGAHRLSAINLLQKRMDPKNPLWKQVKLKVNFGTSADVAAEQGVAEGSDGWIGNPAKWKEAVLQAHGPDVVFKNYTHPGQPGKRSVHAFDTNNKIVGVYQRHNKMGMVQPNLQDVSEGAPIVIAQAPIDVRNPKKAPQPYRNQGDIVPPTNPPSTEKRGVKGRPGQRPMPDYTKDVDENQGWAATFTNEDDYIEEKWSSKYKSSIDCSNPRGFSQRAHCAGRKK
jgi:hypothetical protein